jgi:hypothetical protein
MSDFAMKAGNKINLGIKAQNCQEAGLPDDGLFSDQKSQLG